jgi:pyruvate,orthophosphate dikinase
LGLRLCDGDKSKKDLLGGKGREPRGDEQSRPASAAGVHDHDEACRAYLQHGSEPDGLRDEVSQHLAKLEQDMGRTLGDAADPLLVSVRPARRSRCPA